MSKQESNVLVCKSNELIEARYRLTAVAQKIAACTISRVNPADHANPLPSFKWSIAELSDISGISQQVLRNKLADYTRELKSVVVELRRTDSNSYQQLSLFRVFTYDDDEKQLEIVFEEKLAEYIRDFSRNFTQYQLIQIQKLVSSHSVRIYEILRMAYNRNCSGSAVVIHEIPLGELKAMLGIKRSAYKIFANFRRKVLEVACRELAEKTDLTFAIETVKKGRSVAAIRFHIHDNEQQFLEALHQAGDTPDLVPESCRDEAMLNMLKVVIPSLSGLEALLLVNGYSRELLTDALMDLSRRMVRCEIHDPARYFFELVKNKHRELQRRVRDPFDTSWAEGLDLS